MTATSFADDLVREYLLFRGFIATSKAFEAELKSDKDKGFRADKIVEQLCSYIASYDLTSLREAWTHLDQRVFARLEYSFMPHVRKLENSLLKMYIVNTVQTNRHDKLIEFFERISSELQNQLEWKEWFVLPFIKNPEENPCFSAYFTRQWQDTTLVSLHNFLSVIFQRMTLPTLMSFEEEQMKLSQLQEENENLKQQLASLQSRDSKEWSEVRFAESSVEVPPTAELMDDFYVIAQETPTADTQLKSIKSIIKNISSGLPTSPILGRKQTTSFSVMKKSSQADDSMVNKSAIPRMKTRAPSTGNLASVSTGTHSSGGSSSRTKTVSESGTIPSTKRVYIGTQTKTEENISKISAEQFSKKEPSPVESINKEKFKSEISEALTGHSENMERKCPFLLLSQEEYGEHQSAITHCKFNASGSIIASSDIDGVIKIWSPSPSPRTLATVISKSSILALEWAHKRERLLLHGNRTGSIKLYDTKDKKTLCEIGGEANSPLKDQRITSLACSPSDSYFVCSTTARPRSHAATTAESPPFHISPGSLFLWDMKIMKLEKQLHLEPANTAVNCCVFNHNGQLLLTGAVDGRIRLFDMRQCECITQWQAHLGETFSLQFSTDETSCYSMGSDKKFIQWSINKTGQKLSECILHEKSVGPFTFPSSQIAMRGSHHRPVGKLFAFDAEGKHVLACANTSGVICKLANGNSPIMVMELGGHRNPVVTVDWATTMDCSTCITASLEGRIRVSTLLAK